MDNGNAPPAVLLRIQTLSNRADMISGGDALVEILLPPNTAEDGLHVTVGGKDVSSSFAKRANGRIIGLVTGLANGPNKVTADLKGDHGAALTITSHPIGGPVFTGPQTMPFVCATPTGSAEVPGDPGQPATTPSGLSTLATDVQCNIATEVKLFYRTTTAGCANVEPDPTPAPPNANACFKPYNPASPPTDVAMTTTDAGVTVPFIVRDERGTLNRGIYDIVVLWDPTKGDDLKAGWKPYAPQNVWNGKAVYSFGASSNQPRLQFRSEQHWNNEEVALSKGFLVAFNSMTDSLYNSNRTLMTETLMMMKEKIVDTYGELKYLMGDGCSGGSINQLTSASIFPGLLDGIQPTCTYPDSETTGMEVVDCLQLMHAYTSSQWQQLMHDQGLTQDQMNAKMAAINGHLDTRGCQAWVTSFASTGKPGQYVPFAIDPVTNTLVAGTAAPRNNCILPASMVYSKDHPERVRCSGADNAVSIFGYVTDKDGKVIEPKRARTTTDNTGVQYGLKALKAGDITPEEFVVVNEQAGGVDADAEFTTDNSRTAGDPIALAIAYKAGIVSDGKHLAKTAIIDLRGWDDQGIHHQWRSFALRARLDAANGGHKNHVMWRYGTGLLAPAASGLTVQSFLMMDKWLTSMKADAADAAVEAKVTKDKPADAVDFCYLSTDTGFTTKVTDFAMCDADTRLKPHSSPRQVAGGPLAENILKCQLKPIDRADYPATLTDAQFNRLKAVFTTGVCDFSKPGVGQTDAISPLDFSAGAGGVAFPTPPSTKSL